MPSRSSRAGSLIGAHLPDKKRATLSGALSVFGRDGYARASVEAIADEAHVSTRTIYNHFNDKATLFHTLIEESATQVAAAQIDIIDRYLRKVTDVRQDLIDFGIAWATPEPEHRAHFALVRHINADATHIPAVTIEAWQEAGPMRVRRELASYIAQMDDAAMLRVADPDLAAVHLTVLVSAHNPSLPSQTRNADEIANLVTAGVDVFLHGYSR